MAKQIKFHQNVSATHGIYGADRVYTVADDVAADMIKAKHAVEVDEDGKPLKGAKPPKAAAAEEPDPAAEDDAAAGVKKSKK